MKIGRRKSLAKTKSKQQQSMTGQEDNVKPNIEVALFNEKEMPEQG